MAAPAGYAKDSIPKGMSRRQFYLQTLSDLKAQRTTFDDQWERISRVTHPRRIEIPFKKGTRNRTERNDQLNNNRAQIAGQVLKSGVFSGTCSPTDQWGRMTTADEELAENDEETQVWLGTVERRLWKMMADTNTYDVLEQGIDDLVDYGVTALYFEDDLKYVLRGRRFPIGTYCLATSARGEIDTFYGELALTVGHLVEKFGFDACSVPVQDLYKKGQINSWIDVLLVIQPNRDYTPGQDGPRGMMWKACWVEIDGPDDTDVLGESGYREFPVLTPRWKTDGETVYATSCPGMNAYMDAKELQELELDYADFVAKLVRPPMVAPASMLNSRVSLIPGDVTYMPNDSVESVLRPALQVNGTALPGLDARVQALMRRIDDAYFARLWLMLEELNSGGQRATATEIDQRRNEQRLQLSPLTVRIHGELLRPMVQRFFMAALRSGRIPPWPRAMVGKSLKVEFKSVFTQAQQATSAIVLERLAQFGGVLVNVTQDPSVLDKLDTDVMIDAYAKGIGAPAEATRDADTVEQIRQRKAAQVQQAQQQADVAAQAETAKNLAGADLTTDNALSRLTGGAQPQAAA